MDITDIRLAQERIRPFLKRTPHERSETLSRRLGTNVFVKYELFQRTGSFKARGAFNKLLSLSDEERSRGVVAVSGGNHAQAVAYASSVLGVDSVIIMPESTPRNYVDATRGYGARLALLPAITSIAKTLGAPSVSTTTLTLAQNLLESVTVVPDAEAVEALIFITERLKVITEPAASCTLAAAERLRSNFTPDSNVVLILCG